MRSILHIVTELTCESARSIIDLQRTEAGFQVDVIDLTRGFVNYDDLLDKIFSADSVQVW